MVTRLNSPLGVLGGYNPGTRYAQMHGPYTNWGLFNGNFDQGPSGEDETEPPEGWFTTLQDAGFSEMKRVVGGLTGNWCMRGGSTTAGKRGGELISQKYIPVDLNTDYILAAAFSKSIANVTIDFGVICYDKDKTPIAPYAYILAGYVPVATFGSWDAIAGYILGPSGVAFKANTRYVRVFVRLQTNAALGANAYGYVDAIRLCDPCGGGVQPGIQGPAGPAGADADVCDMRWYDVKCYGAIGDGAAHPVDLFYGSEALANAAYPFMVAADWPHGEMDYLGWQAAVIAAEAAGGGAVYGPAGDYMLSSSIEVTEHLAHVTIMGDGFSTRLFTKHAATLSHLLLIKSSDAAQQICGWTVKDIQLDGMKDGVHTTCSKCLRVTLSDVDVPANGIIDHVWAHDSSDSTSPASGAEGGGIAISLVGTPMEDHYYQGVVISNCYAYDNGDTWAWGIGLNANRGVLIHDCQCWGNKSMGITSWYSQDVTIKGCSCRNNLSININSESSDRVIVEGCLAEGVANVSVDQGIRILNSRYVDILGCIVKQEADAEASAAIRIQGLIDATQAAYGPSHILVSDCILHKFGHDGAVIWLDDDAGGTYDPEEVRIRGCEIINAQTGHHVSWGIYGNAINIEITDNHIESGIYVIGVASDCLIDGNKLLCEFLTASNAIRIDAMAHAVVSNNAVAIDLANTNIGTSFLRVAGAISYLQVLGNKIRGRVDYILYGSGGNIYPSAQGNLIGPLTIDTALTTGITYPPAAAVGTNGGTVWCDWAGSGQPMCYTRTGGAWVASNALW